MKFAIIAIQMFHTFFCKALFAWNFQSKNRQKKNLSFCCIVNLKPIAWFSFNCPYGFKFCKKKKVNGQCKMFSLHNTPRQPDPHYETRVIHQINFSVLDPDTNCFIIGLSNPCMLFHIKSKITK